MLNRPKPITDQQPTAAEKLAHAVHVRDLEQDAVRRSDEGVTRAHRDYEIERSDGAQARYEQSLGAARDSRNRLAAAEKAVERAKWLASPEYAEKWKVVEAAMQDRTKHAANFQRHTEELHDDWAGWLAANRRILALGLIEDSAGGCFREIDSLVMPRLEMVRAGFNWATNTGLVRPEDIPPLVRRVEGANQHILAGRKP